MTLIDWIVVAGALGLGAGAGFGFGWLMRARRLGDQAVFVESVVTDETLDRDIEAAALAWAQSHGRPEIAGLIAHRGKQLWRLRHGRDPRGW